MDGDIQFGPVMDMPLVSIIIPVFNAENFIVETILSAIDQTWENKEIIIVDDGSTDGSFALASKFQNEYIKILRQQNQGASAARNYGLREAKGEYIQFLDADDLLNPGKIKAQMQQLSPGDKRIGLCGTVHFQDGTPPADGHLAHDWIEAGTDDPVDFLIKLYGGAMVGAQYGGMIQPNAWLTPKSVIDKAGPWNESLTLDDDGEFFCRVVLASEGIRYAHEAINYYRKFNNSESLSAKKNEAACKSILLSTQLKTKYLLQKNDSPVLKTVLCRLFWENAFVFYPLHPQLSDEAEKMAGKLAPAFGYQPYNKGRSSVFAKLFGWKFVRYFQYLKNISIKKRHNNNDAN